MIVDASALLWGAMQPATAGFSALLARIGTRLGFLAPTLLRYELSNAIHRKRRTSFPGPIELRIDLARQLVEGIDLVGPTDRLAHVAGRIAERVNCSAYDAFYLALASLAHRPLLTADSGMAAHAAGLKLPAYLLPKDLERVSTDFPATP